MKNSKDMDPADVWASEEKAKEWLNHPGVMAKSDLSKDYLLHKLKETKFDSILEVGSGNGRLIGAVKEAFPVECCSADINKQLAEYVSDKYKIKTYVKDICDLGLEDNSFDLVYTYQVLQHVPQNRIHKALKELKRVAKREIWLLEGYIGQYYRNDYEYGKGIKTHSVDGGSFAYYYDDMDVGVYYSEMAKYKTWDNGKIKLYKIKV